MAENETKGIEPWYRLVRYEGSEKSRGDFMIFERYTCILANPLRCISIVGKDRPIRFDSPNWEGSLTNRNFSSDEEGLVKEYYKKPESEELTLSGGGDLRCNVPRNIPHTVLSNIPEDYKLLSELGDPRYYKTGTVPFPNALAFEEDNGNWRLCPGNKIYFYREDRALNEEVVNFIKEFMSKNLEWLVSRGATDIKRYWDNHYLSEGIELNLVPKIYDALIALGAK